VRVKSDEASPQLEAHLGDGYQKKRKKIKKKKITRKNFLLF